LGQGAACVESSPNPGTRYIRLAADRPSQQGWIFSRVPLTATNWEIEFEFAIHGAGSLHGDGFAMWITKQRAQPGPVYGHADKFEGLGIFFDTYKNNRPGVVFPYVMAMMGDGNTVYDQANDGKANELAGCSVRGKLFRDRSTRLGGYHLVIWDYILTLRTGTRPSRRQRTYKGETHLLPGQVTHPGPSVQV